MARRRRRRLPREPKPAVAPTSAEDLLRQSRAAARAQEERARWQSRVSIARELRTDWERRHSVEQGELYFLGEQNDLDGARSKLTLNRFAATIKTIRPNLFYTMPKFFVRPRAGRRANVAERVAATAEGLLEAIARQDEHLEVSGTLALTQAFFRIGVLKVCYRPRLEPNPRKGLPIHASEGGEPVTDDLGDLVPLRDPMTGDILLEPAKVLTDEAWRWDWVDAANILLPDEGPDSTKWSWIGEEIVVTLDEAKEDDRFDADKRKLLRANETARRLRPAKPARDYPTGVGVDEFLRYVEVYDRVNKRLKFLVEGQDFGDEFLADDPFPDWVDNDPYALLLLGEPILGPDPMPWPVPPVKDWLNPQAEYNIRRRQVMEGAKRGARKIVYDGMTFDNEEEATKALQSPDDMQAAKVTDINRPPVVLNVPPLNADIWRDLPLLDQDWRMITGQPGSRMLNVEGGTATESTFVERAASLREADPQKIVNRWLATAGQKMFQCLKATLTLDFWIPMRELDDKELGEYLERVYGVPREQQQSLQQGLPGLRESLRDRFGKQKWLSVTREQLIFEADVTIAPGSTKPRNLDTERADWFHLLELLGRYPQLALSRLLLEETGAKFGGTISERMLDELSALAQKMLDANARQAGHAEGGASAAGTAAGAQPQAAAIMSALTGNGGGGGG